jgi:hypothetical protein
MNQEILNHPAVKVFEEQFPKQEDEPDEEFEGVVKLLATLDPSLQYQIFHDEQDAFVAPPAESEMLGAATVLDAVHEGKDCYWLAERIRLKDDRVGFHLGLGGSPASSAMSVWVVPKT